MLISAGHTDRSLTEAEVHDLMAEALAQASRSAECSRRSLAGKRVLVIIPDGTRTAPIPLFFRLFHELLGDQVAALDYLVALGTHQPMDDATLSQLVGVEVRDGRAGPPHPHSHTSTLPHPRIFNHRWDLPGTFVTLGVLPAAEVESLSEGRLSLDVPVRLNRLILEYDQLLVCGPVFPHEVVGFSGGNKYFAPGVAGPEIINVTHWLGALMTSMAVIGVADTPVRRMIDRAVSFIPTPRLCFAMVMHGESLHGLYIGSMEEAWRAATELSAQLDIVYVERPLRRVLSVMPEMYDDLWTAAKGMYKLEPAIADGGEVIIYAPHINEISYTHGKVIDEIGYHVRDYFVKQWEHFKGYPWGVLAHSTHLRGDGTYENDIEKPRIKVTLATGVPRERCERIGLGYLDPATVDPDEWAGREKEGILLVRRAGEMLYRVKSANQQISKTTGGSVKEWTKYEEWEAQVPKEMKAEGVWKFYGYRKALFFYDLCWRDCEQLLKHPLGKAVAQQLIRSAGSISANVEEGYGRGYGKDRLRFLKFSLGSARESKGWYYRARNLLKPDVLSHRLSLISEVIALTVTEIQNSTARLR